MHGESDDERVNFENERGNDLFEEAQGSVLIYAEMASLTRLVTPGNGVVVAPQPVVDASRRPLCRRACCAKN